LLSKRTHSTLSAVVIFILWEASFHLFDMKWYLLPPPSMIFNSMLDNAYLLFSSLATTLRIAFTALILSIIISFSLAIIFYLSKFAERSIMPITVTLQVTPIIAIAPLISIWVNSSELATLVCAFLVAFFPLLANTMSGLKSTEKNHLELVQLYGANKYQVLRYVVIPSALPFFLSGLKVSSGLALIGAVVGEFVIGPISGHSGLAYRIIESGYQLDIPKMFASVFLISISGILLFNLIKLISFIVLRKWHSSFQQLD